MAVLDNVQSIVSIVGVVLALIAVIVAAWSLKTNSDVVKAQLYLELRNRFADVNRQLPRDASEIILPEQHKDYHNEQWTPHPNRDKDEFEAIETYWYHTFDEWFTVKRMNHGIYVRLWHSFFERAIFEGLKNRPLRYVLYYLMNTDRTSFSGKKTEFGSDLTKIYNKFRTETENLPKEIFSEMTLPDQNSNSNKDEANI